MKAVILAGGMGTRLRPLTYHMPKPLVPLVDRPMVMHIIGSLPEEVDTVILAVSYMKDRLEEHFSKNDCGRKIILVNEDRPLGTGGALKNVASYLDETFLAFNGDVVCSLDIREMLAWHRAKAGIGTISLWEVEDPTAFGVVGIGSGGRITVFQEKPRREEAVSRNINAGAYVFEPEVLDHIGEGVVSLERDVFPGLLQKGLYGYRFSGHWVDCGTRENLLLAQRELLSKGLAAVHDCTFKGSVRMEGHNHLQGAAFEACTVGPDAVVRPGALVMKGAFVAGSMVMEGAVIGEGAKVIGSIIGPDVKVPRCGEVISTILA
ncbi:MAG: NDP-sugar synthase [Methanomassiliicoccales archaeon]|nr:MAG: NDP-sugar synthase [Methanomassiliicoccales archaeon]